MKLSQLIAKISESLQSAGIDSHLAEARELICHQLGVSKAELSLMELQDFGPTDHDVQQISEFVSLRRSRVPLQHITGKSYFRNLELRVGEGVFIPRPETETLVELALSADVPEKTSLEIGAGSGAISISLSEEGDFAATAVEVSPDAASWAEKNIANYGNSVELVLADFSTFVPLKRYGLLISNPPYIPSSAIPVDPEVYLHDPQVALYSGDDGLDMIRLLADSKDYLLPGGVILFEHDESQKDSIVELLLNRDWREIQSFKDLNGRDRFIQAVA